MNIAVPSACSVDKVGEFRYYVAFSRKQKQKKYLQLLATLFAQLSILILIYSARGRTLAPTQSHI